jgi:hypothetical protein
VPSARKPRITDAVIGSPRAAGPHAGPRAATDRSRLAEMLGVVAMAEPTSMTWLGLAD